MQTQNLANQLLGRDLETFELRFKLSSCLQISFIKQTYTKLSD